MTQRPQPGNGDLYDVVIVGGGAAGLSAALTLGRARRSVVVIDGGEPRNAPAAHMHGFLSREGLPPGQLLEMGRQEVARYGVQVIAGRARSAARDGAGPDRTESEGGFAVELETGWTVGARRLLVTTGITDELPAIPGLRQRWGRDVLHCPYCHGWEVRDQPIGVLGISPMSVHQALLFRQWTDRLIYLPHIGPHPDPEQAEQLAARGIRVVPGEVTGVEVDDDRLSGVRLRSGESIPLQALVLAPLAVPRAEVLDSLGLEATEHPMGVGAYITADKTGLTSVPGVWAAGNLTDPSANVLASAAAGATAAAAINADLVAEDTRRAVEAGRDRLSAEV
ncbi:NAD(P)/FAD-dependent oxidoreductase [Nocardia sp. CNY236]|uniref:NAD(P)/FAD-dependent oxidoreductase n=1 Tax=Nocardia sp. CNY236 TaxID=1169152 RepID=UPI000490BD9D|nr:NAD(P)/FAD-dependent oxidoreductase [Nocardia sp. CNY236]